MAQRKRAVLVTGISGNLGLRLLPQLRDYDVFGADVVPLQAPHLTRYAHIDLGRESACRELVEHLRQTEAFAVVHLAFAADAAASGITDPQRKWQINVAGTARVMEAITEVNRHGGNVRKFIFTSSAQVYGPNLDSPATENSPLTARVLTSAIHKRAADEAVQYRSSSLGRCSTFILRAQNFAGSGVENQTIAALRGIPTAHGERATQWQQEGKRVPFYIPFGERYQQNQWQFVHVDDVARLIAHILGLAPQQEKLTTLNVSGRDGSLSLDRCFHLAATRVVRLPGHLGCRAGFALLSKLGLSSVPLEALPYLLGSYPVDTTRLRSFLGGSYREIIRHTAESALAESLAFTSHDLLLTKKATV